MSAFTNIRESGLKPSLSTGWLNRTVMKRE